MLCLPTSLSSSTERLLLRLLGYIYIYHNMYSQHYTWYILLCKFNDILIILLIICPSNRRLLYSVRRLLSS